jgi:hypothetical protein
MDTPLIEWQVCQTDAEWEAARQAQQPLAPRPLSVVRRFLPLGLCLLLLLAAGGLRWHAIQTKRAALEVALAHTVNAEVQADAPNNDPLTTAPATPGRATSPSHERAAQELQWLAQSSLGPQPQQLQPPLRSSPDGGAVTRLHYLESDVAVVQLMLPATHDQPALRQTRVYQQFGPDWVRIAPTAVHWGARQRLETSYFIFHYHELDAAAVSQAAAQLDALYPTLHAAFFAGPPLIDKIVVWLNPAQPSGQLAKRASWDDPLVVASPAVYLAPEDISDAELLAQALVPALLDDLMTQTAQRYRDYAYRLHTSNESSLWQWLNGAWLWQFWATDLPLAAWRKPVVQWVFGGGQAQGIEETNGVPDFADELCAQHQLWMLSPLEVRIPIVCGRQTLPQGDIVTWQYNFPDSVDMPLPSVDEDRLRVDSAGEPIATVHPASAVALATVMEYAAKAYGPEHIPLLVAALNHHAHAETLIPAVFGVSAAAFEAGWHSYLAEHYGLQSSATPPPGPSRPPR